MSLSPFVEARPVLGGEQPVPDVFDPMWEYDCWSFVTEESYLEIRDRLVELARETLPTGTKCVLSLSEAELLSRSPDALGFYYGPQLSMIDPWVVTETLPVSLEQARAQRDGATGIFAHLIA